MKKAYIKLRHGNDFYYSVADDFTDDELENMKNLIKNALSGNLKSFSFIDENDNFVTFGKKILVESIITICYK